MGVVRAAYREPIVDGYYRFNLPKTVDEDKVQELVSRFWEIYNKLSRPSSRPQLELPK